MYHQGLPTVHGARAAGASQVKLYAEGVSHHSPGLPRFFSGYPGRVECVLAATSARGSQKKATPGYVAQHLRCRETQTETRPTGATACCVGDGMLQRFATTACLA